MNNYHQNGQFYPAHLQQQGNQQFYGYPNQMNQQFFNPQSQVLNAFPITPMIDKRHQPNLDNIQYYAIIEIQINLDDRPLRINEIIEIGLVLVCNRETIYQNSYLVRPTVYNKIFSQTTNRCGLTDENFAQQKTIDEVLLEIEATIGKLPLTFNKNELIFVTMFEETFCKFLQTEESHKNFKLQSYMQNFISISNNFPKELIKEQTFDVKKMLQALDLESNKQVPYKNYHSASNCAHDTANILKQLLKQGLRFKEYQKYDKPINQNAHQNQFQYTDYQPKKNQETRSPQSYQVGEQQQQKDFQSKILNQYNNKVVDEPEQQRLGQKNQYNRQLEQSDSGLKGQNRQLSEENTRSDVKNDYQDGQIDQRRNKYSQNSYKKYERYPQQQKREMYHASDQNNTSQSKILKINNDYKDIANVTNQRLQQQIERQNVQRVEDKYQRIEDKYKRIDDDDELIIDDCQKLNKTQGNDDDNDDQFQQNNNQQQNQLNVRFSSNGNQQDEQHKTLSNLNSEGSSYYEKREVNQKKDGYRSKSKDQGYDRSQSDQRREWNGGSNQQSYHRPSRVRWEEEFFPRGKNRFSFENTHKYWNQEMKYLEQLQPNAHEGNPDLDYLVIIYLKKHIQKNDFYVDEIGASIYDIKNRRIQDKKEYFLQKISSNFSDEKNSFDLKMTIEFLDEYLKSQGVFQGQFVFVSTIYPNLVDFLIDQYYQDTQENLPYYWYEFILLPELHCQLMDQIIRKTRPSLKVLGIEVKLLNQDFEDTSVGKLEKQCRIVKQMSNMISEWGTKYINHKFQQASKQPVKNYKQTKNYGQQETIYVAKENQSQKIHGMSRREDNNEHQSEKNYNSSNFREQKIQEDQIDEDEYKNEF